MIYTNDEGTEIEVPDSIKWRGSVYNVVKVEDNTVHWFNPVSRHNATCSVNSWVKDGDPYGGHYGWHK